MLNDALNYVITNATPEVLFQGWFYLLCWYIETGFTTINGKRKWRWFQWETRLTD